MSLDWTPEFFGGLAVEFWAKVAPPPDDSEIAFLRSIFRDGALLDVACGAGRYTIPLAAAGFSMTGVDNSDDFLALARRRGPDIEWCKDDVRELRWRDRFDGALCFGNSFGYFDPAGTMLFLQGVAAALHRGASFVLETAVAAESILPSLQRSRRIEMADMVFSSVTVYDVMESRLDIEYTFEKAHMRETKRAHTWVYTTREIITMLSAAGFEDIRIYASAAGEPFVLSSPRAIFVATRSDTIPGLNNNKEKRT